MIDPYIVAIDSTLLKARGHVWHKSSMNKGIVPRSGIVDTDARWGFSHTKGWIFGYKLHLISSTGSLIVPLAADFTTANVQDNQMYNPVMISSSPLPSSSSSSLFLETCYMIGDSGYDDHDLYDLSVAKGFQLVCPVQRYEHTPANRLELINFYESELGQTIYILGEAYISRTINRTSKTGIQNRPITYKRLLQGCWNSTPISTSIPNTCLPQSQNQTSSSTTTKSNQTHVMLLVLQ